MISRITSAAPGSRCPRWLSFLDEITGGSGADTFIFSTDLGMDEIADFSAAQDGDVIDLTAFAFTGLQDVLDLTTDESDGALITFDAENSLKLAGVFATEPSVPESATAYELPPVEGEIRLDGVTFGYDPATPGEIGALDKHGNANVLTLDKGTSRLAQGPSAHSALVEIERFAGAAPEITVFDPPPAVAAE